MGISYGDRLVWMSDRDLGAALDDAVEVGARWVRADLLWTNVQPDGPDTYRWEGFDRVVTAVAERGLTLLPVLGFTPAWARPADCTSKHCRPADPVDFAAFAGAAATRYAPRGVHTWEVWNEPNLTRSWAPAPDVGAYTELLKETSQALWLSDPASYVILGGLAATSTKDGDISQTAFLQGVSARGGNRVVDAVGYHPYTYPFLASSVTQWRTPWERIEGTRDSLRSVLVANGTPDMPVWITEFGAPTNGPGTSSDGRPGTVGEETTHVPEERQAQIAADVVRTAAATPHVAALIWYTDRDLGTDTGDSENFFGLRRADGSAKPALGALRDAVADLSRRSVWGAVTGRGPGSGR
ncbi:cellulase family glycosylhydrolase [Streptomyces sp. P9(2023)]|uniref:cellulase family glycosylhydrolase n=1 Tax=Streptomyces sp. P9(2023) TaxID=3064394 RepID=UPI0028F45DCB|nr:cellulase family glycosylhydrolase [Streptomyces sp. P9(2023)]MDT9692818.1 cellulase family glycosylhydrolase [Streptomyces sp. P9(2023)]